MNRLGVMAFISRLKAIQKQLLKCADRTGGTHKTKVNAKLAAFYSNFNADFSLEIGFEYYYLCKNEDMLLKWVDKYLGDNGLVWELGHSERLEIASRLLKLISKYSLQDKVYDSFLISKLKKSAIDYFDRKEYILAQPLNWFECVIKFFNDAWKTVGISLISLSEKIDEIANNREKPSIDDSFVSAVFRSSKQEIWNVYNSKDFYEIMKYNPSNIITGLINLLETSIFTKIQLLEIWSFGIGCLDWRNDVGQSYLACLKTAITANAKKNNIEIKKALFALSKAEFSAEKQIEYIPTFWYDYVKNNIEQIDCQNIEFEIEEFFELVSSYDDAALNKLVVCS